MGRVTFPEDDLPDYEKLKPRKWVKSKVRLGNFYVNKYAPQGDCNLDLKKIEKSGGLKAQKEMRRRSSARNMRGLDGMGVVTRRTRGALGIRLQDENEMNNGANDPALAENNLYVDESGYIDKKYPNRSHPQKKKSDTTKVVDGDNPEIQIETAPETSTTGKDDTDRKSSTDLSCIANGQGTSQENSEQLPQSTMEIPQESGTGITERTETEIPSSEINENVKIGSDNLIVQETVTNENLQNIQTSSTAVTEKETIVTSTSELRVEDPQVNHEEVTNTEIGVTTDSKQEKDSKNLETMMNLPEEARKEET